MANTYFKFKQFTIQQDQSGMKVGTDGVLLGAWANINNSENILDIGTGTGLIAIMCAQRNNSAKIDAIEIDTDTYNQAVYNINECKWSKRISIYNISLQNFSTKKNYDCIISNPPFFNNSTKNQTKKKCLARHTDSLKFSDIISFSINHLSPKGKLCIILPPIEAENFIDEALNKNLFLNKIIRIKPNKSKNPKRIMFELSFIEKDIQDDFLTIETDTRHIYTNDYQNLTKDFYLKM
ncbi:methyltransferase domain-containing protein [Marinilabiliaceae bacterium JC040]|nr:methyltransferase domain-containing protein [Marinilabiliaceae bacterium JC040]